MNRISNFGTQRCQKLQDIQEICRPPRTADAIFRASKMLNSILPTCWRHILYPERRALIDSRMSSPEKIIGMMMLATITGMDTSQNVVVDTSPPSVNSLAFIPKYDDTKARGT